MKSKKISILASSTALFLAVGLISGCAGESEDEANSGAAAIVAPAPSEGVAIEPIAPVEETLGLENIAPIESISDMLKEAEETADGAIDSMHDMVDSGVDTTQGLVEDTKEAALGVIEEPQVQEVQELISDATDVVPATSSIIRGVQQALTDKGFKPGPVDGASGPRTVAAINDFQKQSNLATGGQLTKETLRALGVNF